MLTHPGIHSLMPTNAMDGMEGITMDRNGNEMDK
jgi:hypothetical protein